MQRAPIRGSVEPTQIVFKAKVVPAADTEGALPPGNQPKPGMMKPPYRHSTVVYGADPRDIAFTAMADGKYRTAVEFVAMVYASDGESVNLIGNAVHKDLSTPQYDALLKYGATIQERQEIDAPAKGEFFLRLGIHDLTNDHVGAVEIRLSDLKAEEGSNLAR